MTRRGAWLWGAVLAGCYQASPRDCLYRCGAGASCPEGLECREAWCRTSGAAGLCVDQTGDGASNPDGLIIPDGIAAPDGFADARPPPDAMSCGPGSCAGCCAGGMCQTGDQQAVCGTGGAPCQDCGATPCASGSCGACAVGTMETLPCGNCGTQSRTCQAGGTWGPFGMCMGQGPCAYPSERDVPCGHCGTERQTCSTTCQWQGGSCLGQGECSTGERRWCVCMDCGVYRDDCDDTCNWVRATTCQSECGTSCPATCECPNLTSGCTMADPTPWCGSACCP